MALREVHLRFVDNARAGYTFDRWVATFGVCGSGLLAAAIAYVGIYELPHVVKDFDLVGLEMLFNVVEISLLIFVPLGILGGVIWLARGPYDASQRAVVAH